MSLSIGIDIGTTGTKTVLFDTSRGILAETSRETTLFSPAPGFAEADTGQWLTNVIDSIREIRSQSGIGSGDVDAVAVSGMVPAVVPVDSRGAARRTVAEGGAYVNNVKVGDEQWVPTADDLLDGRWLVLRRGKRNVAGVRVDRG